MIKIKDYENLIKYFEEKGVPEELQLFYEKLKVMYEEILYRKESQEKLKEYQERLMKLSENDKEDE